MVNAYLSVIDHGITINWEQGPTLHKLLAQVRYRNAEDGPVLTMRVGASQRCAEVSDDMEDFYCFAASNGDVAVQWVWQARDIGDNAGWIATLKVRNMSDESIWLEGIDIVRIDAETGLMSLGAPVTDWRVETVLGQLRVWPKQSDRGEPMVVALKAMPIDESFWSEISDATTEESTEDQEDAADAMPSNASDEGKLAVQTISVSETSAIAIDLDVNSGRFNHIAATLPFDRIDLPPNSGLTTQGVMIWAEPI